jgi:hypothetical protein
MGGVRCQFAVSLLRREKLEESPKFQFYIEAFKIGSSSFVDLPSAAEPLSPSLYQVEVIAIAPSSNQVQPARCNRYRRYH